MKQTQLIQYIKEGNLQKVKEEVEQGVIINIQTEAGYTALIWASRGYGNLDIVKFLNSLKGPLSLQHIILNLIEKENVPINSLPDVLFVR